MQRQDQSSALAEAMLAFRLSRSRTFPGGLFGETGWEFLLALYIADADGRPTTGRQICNRIEAFPDTASRWLKYLSSEGLIDGDGDGNLDDPLVMAPAAVERMEQLLGHAQELRAMLLPDM